MSAAPSGITAAAALMMQSSPRVEEMEFVEDSSLRRAKPITAGLSEERETYISCEMERKRILQDSILLANRLALLQAAEYKSMCKIKEAQRSAKKLIETRHRKDELRLRRQEESQKKATAQKILQERARQQSEEQKKRVADKRSALLAQKSALRQESRSQRDELYQAARYADDDFQKRRAEKRAEVLASRDRTKAQREAAKQRIDAVCRSNFQEKFEMTEMSVEYQLEVKEKMAHEELAYIERLQAAQHVQNQVLEDYKRLLYGDPVPENSLLMQNSTISPR